MDNDFTNHEIQIENLPQFEEVDFNRVSKSLLGKNICRVLFMYMFFSGIILTIHYLEKFETDVLMYIFSPIILLFLFQIITVFLKQKKYGYSLREKDIIYTQGFFVSRLTVIPFNRIQHSSVNRSVLDKLFRISTLNIYTAGGSGSDMAIQGLKPDLAKSLNEVITQNIRDYE